MSSRGIDTIRRDADLRTQVVDHATRAVLMSRIGGTGQEADLSSPTNCDGFGRIRHFRRNAVPGWPENPLPIDPAARWLRTSSPSQMTAQVFQIAACAWRCWYCYVPYASLRADPATSEWWTAEDLVDAYIELDDRPPILDLSGGSPDLVPEWIAWTLEAIEARRAVESTFVWSDDNLSSTRLVEGEGRKLLASIARHRNYGRACCLKGFDGSSFAFNTRAHPDGFERQLSILSAYAASGMDIYLYLPLVGPPGSNPECQIKTVVDRLAAIRPDLPYRTVPLFIGTFKTMEGRLDTTRRRALDSQWELLEHWMKLVPAVVSIP